MNMGRELYAALLQVAVTIKYADGLGRSSTRYDTDAHSRAEQT